MSQLYKRMLLIRPDVLEKYQKGNTASSSSSQPLLSHPNQQEDMSEGNDGPHAAYIRREIIKDSLSPFAPTVNVLEHLQNEMARVLKDPTMDTEEKLATYNDLMTRSQILTSKAKSMVTEHYDHHTPLLHSPDNAKEEADNAAGDADETVPEKRPIPLSIPTLPPVLILPSNQATTTQTSARCCCTWNTLSSWWMAPLCWGPWKRHRSNNLLHSIFSSEFTGPKLKNNELL